MTTATDELSRVVAAMRAAKNSVTARYGVIQISLDDADLLAKVAEELDSLRTQLSAAVAERDAAQAAHHRDLDLSNKCIDALTRERDTAREALRQVRELAMWDNNSKYTMRGTLERIRVLAGGEGV